MHLTTESKDCSSDPLGFSAFARRYLRNNNCFIFLLVLKCFTSQGAPRTRTKFGSGLSRTEASLLVLGRFQKLNYILIRSLIKSMGFPHSEISGSKVARHLPEAYRRHATSFIAISSQGIHHTPLNFLLGNPKTILLYFSSCLMRLKSLRHFCSTSDPKRPRRD